MTSIRPVRGRRKDGHAPRRQSQGLALRRAPRGAVRRRPRGLNDHLGVTCVDEDEALDGAEVVVLAVPDTLIGRVLSGIEAKLTGRHDGDDPRRRRAVRRHLPERAHDLTYFVTHPCHPPIFNDETAQAAKRDFFGGVAAKQHFVSALMQGPDEAYALGEEIAKVIWAPVMRSHRITVEQMALLEPGLSETVTASLLVVMREAMDEVVRRGVRRRRPATSCSGT